MSSGDAAARLEEYKSLLLAWNTKINLIGPEARDHVDEHIEEAVVAAGLLEVRGEVLDFGSGGGLPAIPMAIVRPSARFHLVEVDQKKWAFLKHVVRECQLNAVVHGDRLDRALTRLPAEQRFDFVVSRAVGRAEEWVPLLGPFLSPGAVVGLFQGTPDAPKLESFEPGPVHRLPRGTSNYLVTLMFHVEP